MRSLRSLLLAAVLSGCYVTVPLANPTRPEPGTKLVVQLTDAGADDLARYLGPGVAQVDGRLLQASDTGLQLAVSQVSMRSGQEQFWKGEAVTLPRATIATVQQRKMSTTRSALLAGIIIAGAISVKVGADAIGGNRNGSGGHQEN